MSKTAMSSAVWGVYLFIAGAGFLFIPNLILPIVGLPTTTEVWIHVLGLLVAILGAYYFYCAQHNVIPFFRATVPGRFAFALGLLALVLLDLSGPSLLIFAILDSVGAIWTWSSLRLVTGDGNRTG